MERRADPPRLSAPCGTPHDRYLDLTRAVRVVDKKGFSQTHLAPNPEIR